MDPEQESLLVSTCSALGGFEHVSEDWDDDTEVYVMGDECLGAFACHCSLACLLSLFVFLASSHLTVL